MLRPSELVFSWKLSQKIKVYLDNNENGIFDKQDTIKYESNWSFLNSGEMEKITQEISKNKQQHTIKFETTYYKWSKEIGIWEYNQNLFLYNTIDVLFVAIFIFFVWFLLFPKKIKND